MNDRLIKYGYGVIRLSLIFYFITSFYIKTNLLYQSSDILPFLPRWFGCIYLGSIGAPVNIKIYNISINLLLLIIGGLYCLYDLYIYQDYIMLIYLLKTFTGDYLTNKLDTIEWKLVLFFIYGLLIPFFYIFEPYFIDNLLKYLKIFLLLFLIQFICEYGDHYYESYTFFRHRYSYEIFNLFLILFIPLQDYELNIIQFDILICLFYRISNSLFIIISSSPPSPSSSSSSSSSSPPPSSSSDYLSILENLKILGFKLHGWLIGIPVINVTDPEIAMLVMKNSVDKGYALERYIATPAWKPILSIESVDGKVWRQMSENFHSLLPLLPSVSHLQTVTKYHTDQLIRNKQVSSQETQKDSIIDAEDIAKLSMIIFLDFLFGIRLSLESNEVTTERNKRILHLYELFTLASWEWRKEISVRGKADLQIKSKTIQTFLLILEEPERYVSSPEDINRVHKIYAKFGDKWRLPKYYSLILQPFLISPCINTGDIMVAIYNYPSLPMESAIRQMHPFPIFERYVAHDITIPCPNSSSSSSLASSTSTTSSNKIVIKGNTQVIMFTADFIQNSSFHWNIFGGGERICSGMSFALPYLKILSQSFHELLDSEKGSVATSHPRVLFRPELNHRYSGRNNDGKTSLFEIIYLIQLVGEIFLREIVQQVFKRGSDGERSDEEGEGEGDEADNKTDRRILNKKKMS